jgi:hypothetical protein
MQRPVFTGLFCGLGLWEKGLMGFAPLGCALKVELLCACVLLDMRLLLFS